jgi:hypothetical protein
MYRIKLYIYLFLFITVSAFSQDKQVLVSLDSMKIRVGSQANLTLKTVVEEGTRVVFPRDNTFGLLEVLESYPVDTIEIGDKYQLIKKYGLTQFDSGRYAIPPLSVIIDNKDYKTDTFYLEVANVKVDTTKQKMYDIKPVASQASESDLWWYILIAVSFIIIGLGIYWDIKRRKKKQRPEVYIAPVEKAAGALKRLDSMQLLQKGQVKEYYSELSRIARTYIEETIEIPAMESTTRGVLEDLKAAAPGKRMIINDKIYHDLERVLTNSDMVKFAMSRPDDEQITSDRILTEQTVNAIEGSLPEPTQEEIELTEVYRQQQEQKKLRRKRTVIIAVCSVLVIGTLAFFGFQRLYGYLQENVIGYDTKDLWEGEWVKSEYGNPAVTINTPKVLKRTNIAQMLPKEILANFQEIQAFEFGPAFGTIHIGVSTIKFMPGVQANIDGALNQSISIWESMGAKNITVNTEVFTLQSDEQGVRAFGTLSYSPAGSSSKRYYYEIIYFQQLEGIQQIVIMRQDQDEFGIKIAEKVKKSIEFKTVL